MSQPEQDKPKYGQYQQPEYGAMSGQYGPNYNPYIYGAPEPDTKKDSAAAAGDNGGAAQSQQAGQPYGQQPAWPGNQQAGGWPYAQGGQQSGPGAYPGGYPGMQGQRLGQRRFTGVRVADDGERTATGGFGGDPAGGAGR